MSPNRRTQFLLAALIAATISPSLADAIDPSTPMFNCYPCVRFGKACGRGARGRAVATGARSRRLHHESNRGARPPVYRRGQAGSLVELFGCRQARDSRKRRCQLSASSGSNDLQGGGRRLPKPARHPHSIGNREIEPIEAGGRRPTPGSPSSKR